MKKESISETEGLMDTPGEGGQEDRSRSRWCLLDVLALLCAVLAYFLLDLRFRAFFPELLGLAEGHMEPMYFSLCWALGLAAFGYIVPRTVRRIWWIVSMLVYEAGFIVSIALYRLTGTMFSFAAVAYAEDGARFFSFRYLNLTSGEWITAGLSLLLMAAAVILTRKASGRSHRITEAVCAGLVIAVCAGIITAMDNELTVNRSNQSITWANTQTAERTYKDAYSDLDRINEAVMANGLYQYLFRSLGQALFPDEWTAPAVHAELNSFYAENPRETDSPYAGLLKGDNLIMIMMESMDEWLVTPEYMPNLYALMQDSKSFTNFYAPLFIPAATFNTEFTANTGLLAPTGGIANEAYTDTYFPYSLAHLFGGKGYIVNSFHSAEGSIYNRENIHLNLGYEHYYNFRAMEMENYKLDSKMNRAFWLYAQTVQDEKPFYSFMITYSGHGPYDETNDDIAQPHMEAAKAAIDWSKVPYEGEAEKEEYLRAVAQAMETDEFIGGMVEMLKRTGRDKNTALVIFADHYCKYITDTDFVMRIKSAENRDLLGRVPFMIWSDKLSAEALDTAVTTADIVPTLVSLFGLDADLRYFVGSDMFSSDVGLAALAEGHWMDGSVYYDGRNYWDASEYAAHKAGAQLKPLPDSWSEDALSEITQKAAKRLDISWKTFRSDYFRYLQEKEEQKQE